MQPYEQTFFVSRRSNASKNNEDQMPYYLDTFHKQSHADFRPTFYNPFEIKHRKRTTQAQLKILEKWFLENPKPSAAVRRHLALHLNMTPRGVQIWFQNRRAKAKLSLRKSSQEQSDLPQQKSVPCQESAYENVPTTPASPAQLGNGSPASISVMDTFGDANVTTTVPSPRTMMAASTNVRDIATAAAAAHYIDSGLYMVDPVEAQPPVIQGQPIYPFVHVNGTQPTRRNSCPEHLSDYAPMTTGLYSPATSLSWSTCEHLLEESPLLQGKERVMSEARLYDNSQTWVRREWTDFTTPASTSGSTVWSFPEFNYPETFMPLTDQSPPSSTSDVVSVTTDIPSVGFGVHHHRTPYQFVTNSNTDNNNTFILA